MVELTTTKVWLITGASGGLGLALTKRALARGDRVLAGVRSAPKFPHHELDEIVSERLHLFELDVSLPFEDIKHSVDGAIKVWGRVDVVVNNAGVGIRTIQEEGGAEFLQKSLQTNLFGVINVTNAILPHMRERRDGTVVIIGSRSAWRNEFPGIGVYAVSKAAVHSYGETLSAEVQPFNIRVLIVCPGSFKTPGIYPATTSGAPIADYEPTRQAIEERFSKLGQRPGQGDPMVGMDILVDVVKGEGKAKGKPWPLWLPLGADAVSDIRARQGRITKLLDDWEEVVTDVGSI
ncbi:NAD-P-binding protein [Dentipellis sp. KUC8613]|nr:NAD-P-binding protein [Dentipellis sp. KUC8613]